MKNPQPFLNGVDVVCLLFLGVLWFFWYIDRPIMLPGSFTAWGVNGAHRYGPGDHKSGEWGWSSR